MPQDAVYEYYIPYAAHLCYLSFTWLRYVSGI